MRKKPTHVVILRRTGFETIVRTGSESYCTSFAQDLNDVYQTDEYKVEPWDESKVRAAAEFKGKQ